jgi:hypothetical protein
MIIFCGLFGAVLALVSVSASVLFGVVELVLSVCFSGSADSIAHECGLLTNRLKTVNAINKNIGRMFKRIKSKLPQVGG